MLSTYVALAALFGANAIGASSCSPGSAESLNADNPTSDIAQLTMVDPDGTARSDGAFQCTNWDRDNFCVQMNVCNTGCTGVETIKIDVEAQMISQFLEVFTTIGTTNSAGNFEFFSYFNDMDGKVKVQNTLGGVFAAPVCGSEILSRTDASIANFFDEVLANGQTNRVAAGGGTEMNYQLLTSDTVEDRTPVKFTIVNDVCNDRLETYFEAQEVTASCSYGTALDLAAGNDLVVAFGGALGKVRYHSFNVEVTCDASCPSADPCRDGFSLKETCGCSSEYCCEREVELSAAESDYNACESENCLDGEIVNCETQTSEGCEVCMPGFFNIDQNYPCVECDIIENCTSCDTNGCTACDSGYTLYPDIVVGYDRCTI